MLSLGELYCGPVQVSVVAWLAPLFCHLLHRFDEPDRRRSLLVNWSSLASFRQLVCTRVLVRPCRRLFGGKFRIRDSLGAKTNSGGSEHYDEGIRHSITAFIGVRTPMRETTRTRFLAFKFQPRAFLRQPVKFMLDQDLFCFHIDNRKKQRESERGHPHQYWALICGL